MSKDDVDSFFILVFLIMFGVGIVLEEPYMMAGSGFFAIFIMLESIYEEVTDE